jgi:cobalt-zinc-cadmium efflux system outer membrane protein
VFLPYNPSLKGEVERFEIGDFSYGEFRVGIAQRFPISGERGAELEAANAYQTLVDKKLEEARWQATVNARRAYFTGRVRIRRFRFARRVRQFSRKLLSATQKRFEGGQISKIEVATARAQLVEARQRVDQARADLKTELHHLAELTGMGSEALPWPTDELPTVTTLPGEQLTSLKREARKSAPTIEVRQAARTLADRRTSVARRRAWPDPTVGVFFKNQAPRAGGSFNGLVGGLTLPLPIWQRNQAGKADAKAARAVADSKLSARRQRLGTDIKQAGIELQGARRQLQLFRTTAKPAFASQLSLLEKGYRAGEFDVTDVTVAEQRLVQQQMDALDALQTYVRAMTRLERLTGVRIWASNDGPTP